MPNAAASVPTTAPRWTPWWRSCCWNPGSPNRRVHDVPPLASASHNATPRDQHIVLAGGGYAHLLLMRRWARQPLPGVKLTLVSPQTELPYSAMLPGLLAGEYTHQESHIDLRRLCRSVGVQLVLDEVRGVEREQ